jgi:chemotaxis response regulator CheB
MIRQSKNKFYVVGIGASAGSLNALRDFFSNIKSNFSVSYVVILHLPADSKTSLHEILSEKTEVPVTLLSDNILTTANNIYVLPGHLRVRIEKGLLVLRERSSTEVVNYAIDEFLFSLAQDQREKGIAIVFSGGGSDGAKGAKLIHEKGGIVLVQDPESAIADSMPAAAIKVDNPHAILFPKKLGQMLMEIIKSKELA